MKWQRSAEEERRLLDEWNAMAGRPAEPPPPQPTQSPEDLAKLAEWERDEEEMARDAADREEADRAEMAHENRWRREHDLPEWTWPEWCNWHGRDDDEAGE